jgi:hypothetical protein
LEEGMSKRSIGFVLILFGLVGVIVCLSADAIGLGAAPDVIGWKQWSGTTASVVVVLTGLWFMWRAVSEAGAEKRGKPERQDAGPSQR